MGKFGKILSYVLWGLLIISGLLIVTLMGNNSSNAADPAMNSWLNTNTYWLYCLFIILCLLVVAAAIYQTISDKNAAKRGLITISIFFVLILVSYLLSSGEIPQFLGVDKFIESGTLTSSVSRWIDTGLIITYILFGLAMLSLMASSVFKYFEK